MGHLLSHPVTSKFVQRVGDRYYRCGAAEMQGYRTSMEDTHNTILAVRQWKHSRSRLQAAGAKQQQQQQTAAQKEEERKDDGKDAAAASCSSSSPSSPSPSPPPAAAASAASEADIAFFAVYDGHSGPAAAEWACVDLPARVADLPDPFDRAAVIKMVLDSDAAFCRNTQVRAHGCTACFAIVQPIIPSAQHAQHSAAAATPTAGTEDEPMDGSSSPPASSSSVRYRVLIGNLGDSRCIVLGVDGRIRFVTSDHKPENEAESRRIRAAGGSVSYNRVDGELAMSRALGDWAYKGQPHLSNQQQKVIALADIATIECVTGEALLIMCDGLVEKLSNEQVVQFVQAELSRQSRPYAPHLVMQQLIDYSLDKGSKDNMSCILVLLEDGQDYAADDQYVPGSIKEGEEDRKFIETYLAYAKRHGIESGKCLTGDHRVLTRRGWQSIKHVLVGDEALSLNIDKKDAQGNRTWPMEWKPVLAVQSHAVDRRNAADHLFRMQGSDMDVLATRDHRMLLARLSPCHASGLALGTPVGYETVNELLGLTYAVSATASVASFAHKMNRAVVRAGAMTQPAVKIVIPGLAKVCDWWWQQDGQLGFLQFLGFWLGDGHLNVEHGVVGITQKKEEGKQWLEQLLPRVFPRWCSRCPQPSRPGFVTYTIRCPPLYDYLRLMAVGPLGYNPCEPAALRSYPHFTMDARLAAAEQQSAYYAIGNVCAWTEGEMLAEFNAEPRCFRCGEEEWEKGNETLCEGCECGGYLQPAVPPGDWLCPACRASSSSAPHARRVSLSAATTEASTPRSAVGERRSSVSSRSRTASAADVDMEPGAPSSQAWTVADLDALVGTDGCPVCHKKIRAGEETRACNGGGLHDDECGPLCLRVAHLRCSGLEDRPDVLWWCRLCRPAQAGGAVAVDGGEAVPAAAHAEAEDEDEKKGEQLPSEPVEEDKDEDEDANEAVGDGAARVAGAVIIPWDNGLRLSINGHWFYLKRWLGNRQQMYSVYSRLSRQQAVALLDGFCRADGEWRLVQYESDDSGEPAGQWRCSSSSFPLIDQLMLIGQLAGAAVDLRLHSKAGETRNIDGRAVTFTVDHWQLLFTFTEPQRLPLKIAPLAQPVDVSDDAEARGYYDYEDDGKVYDITVQDNANFLTQRLSITRLESGGHGVRAHSVFVGNCLTMARKADAARAADGAGGGQQGGAAGAGGGGGRHSILQPGAIANANGHILLPP